LARRAGAGLSSGKITGACLRRYIAENSALAVTLAGAVGQRIKHLWPSITITVFRKR